VVIEYANVLHFFLHIFKLSIILAAAAPQEADARAGAGALVAEEEQRQ
jgi:hypothetical protein